jgi:hypothetical protein
VGRLGNQVFPMIHTLFKKKWCSFPRTQCPHSHRWNCPVIIWITWRWTSTSSLTSTIIRFEYHWDSLVNLETRLRNCFPPPTSLKQEEDILQEEWHKIRLQIVQNLYESNQRISVAVSKEGMVKHHNNKQIYIVLVLCPLLFPTAVTVRVRIKPPKQRRRSSILRSLTVGFEVLTAVVIKSCVLWDMTTRSPLKVNRSF